MDPMTVLITALGAGAAMLKPAVDRAVVDAYTGLKNHLVRKFGARDPALESVLTHHAADPDAWKQPAQQVLAAVGADRDQEILDRATELLKRAESARPGISGGLVGQITAQQGGRVNVVGRDSFGPIAGRDIYIGDSSDQALRRAPGWVKAMTGLGTLLAVAGLGLFFLTLFTTRLDERGPPPGIGIAFAIFFAGFVIIAIASVGGALFRRSDD
jgi:hypothetical protein